MGSRGGCQSNTCGKSGATDHRMVRRSELHRIVPLSDTMIYELNSAASFLDDLTSLLDASYGTWLKSMPGWKRLDGR